MPRWPNVFVQTVKEPQTKKPRTAGLFVWGKGQRGSRHAAAKRQPRHPQRQQRQRRRLGKHRGGILEIRECIGAGTFVAQQMGGSLIRAQINLVDFPILTPRGAIIVRNPPIVEIGGECPIGIGEHKGITFSGRQGRVRGFGGIPCIAATMHPIPHNDFAGARDSGDINATVVAARACALKGVAIVAGSDCEKETYVACIA